jgi:hypothetical protein
VVELDCAGWVVAGVVEGVAVAPANVIGQFRAMTPNSRTVAIATSCTRLRTRDGVLVEAWFTEKSTPLGFAPRRGSWSNARPPLCSPLRHRDGAIQQRAVSTAGLKRDLSEAEKLLNVTEETLGRGHPAGRGTRRSSLCFTRPVQLRVPTGSGRVQRTGGRRLARRPLPGRRSSRRPCRSRRR